MPLEVVTGPPFAGKGWWIADQIESREADGERGLLAINFTAIYTALAPGDESAYRDEEVTDTGVPRLAAYLFAAAVGEAGTRDLAGYVATDSPRRAVDLLERIGGNELIEVRITEPAAIRRAERHVEQLRQIATRAGATTADAIQRCRRIVRQYYRERDVLDTVDVRQVSPPDRPSDQAIQYAWRAAIKAAKRGNTEARDKWTGAAKRMLLTRGVKA